MKILAIDDDELTQQFILHVLKNEYSVHLAPDGEEGIKLAIELQPDIIILDVMMPGMNGYQVCKQLKQDPATADIPVLFLSANTSLEEQKQGYSAGGDDYLLKPCDPQTLRAEVKVVLRFRDQQIALKQQYTEAQKTAHIAMIGSSEIGMALQFLENSYRLHDYENLARAFFSLTDKLQLICAVMFFTHEGPLSFFSDGSFSPLEQELLQKMRHQQRIFDFQQRTFFNFPNVTLLVKNMPVNEPERNGRIKDLLPFVMGGLSNKIFTMQASHAIQQQSQMLAMSFDQIKSSLLSLSNSLRINQADSAKILHTMLREMHEFLPKLALEEDQENYILDHIEKSSKQALELNDSSSQIDTAFNQVVKELEGLLEKQQQLLTELRPKEPSEDEIQAQAGFSGNVDLF